jgi:hypothetical protein
MTKKILLIVPLLLFYCISGVQGQAISKQKKFPLTQIPSRNSGMFNYTLSVVNEPYADITGGASINNGEAWDDPTYFFEIGFDFELNGNTINFLEFDGLGGFLRSETANPDVDAYLFPFETDLIDRGYNTGISESPISYTVEGDPGSRIMKLEMKNVGSYDEYAENGDPAMYMNFQMWLYEGSNIIEFRFGEYDIPNPDLFFAAGIYCGLADYNFIEDIIINPHFIGGSAAAPQLSISDITLEDNPENGVVYRLTPIAPIDITVTGQNSTSFCNPNGSATVAATGGTEPYTYLWSNGETTPTITNLDEGTYSVTVTDAVGGTVSGSVDITSPGPLNPNAGATDETAVDANDGTAFAAAFGGTPPYSFLWSNGETTQNISGLAPGEYTITVTDAAGCTASETVYVNAFECGDIELNAFVEHPTCSGLCDGSIFLNPSGGTAPYEYVWSNGVASQDVDNLCAGTIIVIVTDAAGCVLTAEFELTDPPAIVVGATATDETGLGLNDGTATASPSGGTGTNYTYLWSNDSTTQVITNLFPGDYTVTVTDENGCTAQETVTVDIFSCSFLTQDVFSDISCYGLCDGGIAIFPIGGSGNFTFLWNTGDTTNELDSLCPGSYSVTVNEVGTGCEGISFFELSQPDSISVVIDAVIPYSDISTGAIFMTVSGGTPDYAIVWFDANGGLVGIGEDIQDLGPGYYYAWITDAAVCAIYTDTIEIEDLTVSTSTLQNVNPKIYPNPVTDRIRIELDALESYTLQLQDATGRINRVSALGNEINVAEMQSGLYFLRGFNDKHQFTYPLVIMK